MGIKIIHLLLLPAGLLTLTDAIDKDTVTWAKCKENGDYRGRVLDSLPDINATDLDIMLCDITKINTEDFLDLPNLVLIYLNNNELEEINPAVFDNCRKLIGIRLDYNKLHEIPAFGEHISFPDVQWIDLSRNLISRIDNPRTFSPKIQDINLDYNPIEHLHTDLFKGLPELQVVSLCNTKLVSLSTTFQIKSLRKLYLRQNLIEYLPPDAFKNTKLEVLNIEGNKLSFLPEKFFSNVETTILDVFFYSNPWQCACLLDILAELMRIGMRNYGAYDLPFDENSRTCVFVDKKCNRNSSLLLVPNGDGKEMSAQ